MSRANLRRTKVAGCCLTLFTEQTGSRGIEGVTDLIADLGHWSDAHDVDFLDCVASAIGHWNVERRGNEHGNMPLVDISIDRGVP